MGNITRHLLKNEYIHFSLSVVLSLVSYMLYGNLVWSVAVFLVGLFIDVDHILDYLIYLFQHKKTFNFRNAITGAFFLEVDKLYVVLHSWELIFVLFLMFFFSGYPPFFLIGVSLSAHFLIDQFTNPVNWKAYFFLFRLFKGFKNSYFAKSHDNVLILNHNQENFGTYWRCLNIARCLAENEGMKVTMTCASGKPFDLLVRTKQVSENFKIVTLPRIKYHKYFTGQILRMFIHLYQVIFYNYDTCYAFAVAQPQIGIPAFVAKKIRGKKLVVDWDDLWGGGFASEHSGPVEKALTYFEKRIPHYADEMTYVSELLGDKIKELNLRISCHKTPNGSNTLGIPVIDKRSARSQLNLENAKKYLVSVGNTYTESLGILLESFSQVLAKDPDVFLIMVGEGEITNKYKDLYQRVEKNVIKTGKRPFAEIPFYLAAADCLVLPMEDNPIEKARFPMRFGDYLCAERPIVSNAVGEVLHYLTKYHAGLISPPKDTRLLSENILKCLENSKTAETISNNARRLAENDLEWGKIVKKLVSVL